MGKHRQGQDQRGHGAPGGQISDRLPNSDDEGWSPPRDAKSEIKPETLANSSGYHTGDPNRGRTPK